VSQGKLIRTLSEHAHWVNTVALSTDFVLRTGPFDHTGKVPKDDEEGKRVVHIGAFTSVYRR
jgi:ribosome assembly protein 4